MQNFECIEHVEAPVLVISNSNSAPLGCTSCNHPILISAKKIPDRINCPSCGQPHNLDTFYLMDYYCALLKPTALASAERGRWSSIWG